MAKATPIRGLSAHAALREAGPRILAGRLRDLQRCLLRRGRPMGDGLPAEAAVHDVRVAARRLRAALRLLRRREEEAPVKKLQDALGAVRDLQLQIAWLQGRDEALAARRKALLKKAVRALDRALLEWRFQALPQLLEAAGGEFSGRLSGARVRKLLRKRLLRFEERLKTALRTPTPPAMHAVRRTAKQLRYLFELLRPAFPALSKALLVELTPLEGALGELHDVDLRLPLLRDPKLLREQRKVRQRLLRAAVAGLERWQRRRIAPWARRWL